MNHPEAVRVAGLAKCSTIDFPGYLACVVFFRGCDLDCFYCHNRELLAADRNDADQSWSQIDSFLKKRAGMLEGVVFSGGEPTLRPQLRELMAETKALGYRIKLDTNGQRPGVVSDLWDSGLADYIAVDLKATRSRWQEVCGGSYEKTLETIENLHQKNAAYEARTTLYPGMTAAELLELAEAIPPVPRWRLNLFRQPEAIRPGDEERLAQSPLTPVNLKLMEDALKKHQPGVILPQ